MSKKRYTKKIVKDYITVIERRKSRNGVKTMVWQRDKCICFYCGMDMKDIFEKRCIGKLGDVPSERRKLLTVDHVKPISAGGKWELSNLVTACLPCNQLKADTYDLEESISTQSESSVSRVLALLALQRKRST